MLSDSVLSLSATLGWAGGTALLWHSQSEGLALSHTVSAEELGSESGSLWLQRPCSSQQALGRQQEPLGQQTFPAAYLYAVPERSPALGIRGREGSNLLLPQEEATIPCPPPPPPRSSGAQAQTSRDLAQPNGRCGAWGRSVTQSKRPWARCRRRGEGVGEGKVDGGCKDSNYINIFPFRRAVASTPQSNLPNTFGAHQGPGGAGRGTDLSEAKDRLCPPKADGLTGSPWG